MWDVRFAQLLAILFMLVSCVTYTSNLFLEETSYSDSSVDFHRITSRYFPQDTAITNMVII
jgi:hypothetical protein